MVQWWRGRRFQPKEKVTEPRTPGAWVVTIRSVPLRYDELRRVVESTGEARVYFGEALAYLRGEAVALLRERGIGCGVFYPLPLHRQRCFAPWAGNVQCPRADAAGGSRRCTLGGSRHRSGMASRLTCASTCTIGSWSGASSATGWRSLSSAYANVHRESVM